MSGVVQLEKNILVCVKNPMNAEKLIERGSKLAKAFQIECFVLTNTQEEYDELNYELVHKKKVISRLCKKYNATFFLENNEERPFTKIVEEIVLEKEIGHVVIGHSVKNKWAVITKGSVINELFAKLSDIDLHLVEVKKGSLNLNEKYERGIYVNIKNVDGKKVFDYNTEIDSEIIQAIFFQHRTTEFQNGILKIKKDGEIIFCKVHDGEIDDWKTEKDEI